MLGAVEGITEFLPISSTGHLILTANILHIVQTDFVKSFEIFIQLGAILAIVVLYWRKIFLNKKIFLRICAAFIPTAVIGLALYSVIKHYLIGNTAVVLWSLGIGGIAIILFEHFYGKKERATIGDLELITYKQAVLIGVFQSIAVIPGVSRSAATVIGGLWLGLSRKTIVEFSFLLAVPTMAAASGLDLLKSSGGFSTHEIGLLALGFITSFVFALVAVKFLLKYIQNHTFAPFGVYRIILACIGIALLIL